jgi:hypothetical protein
MRLGKERAAGYVADVETDEIPETLAAPELAAPDPVALEMVAPEPVTRGRETAATTG